MTAMAATLVCQRCNLTTVQQRWQWQRCNITVRTSVTAVTTGSAGGVNWQRRCDSDVHISVTAMCTAKVVASDSAVTALSVVIAVTLMCASLSQYCHYHCCHNAVLVFTATALCSFSLPQRCACFHCHSAVLVSLPQRCARFRCHSAVLVFAATALCASVSDRCGIPPVKYVNAEKDSCSDADTLQCLIATQKLARSLFLSFYPYSPIPHSG